MNLRQYISLIRYPDFFLKAKKTGKNIRLGKGGLFSNSKSIEFGSNIYIGPHFHISANGLKLGNNILIGPNLLLECNDHIYNHVGKKIWETRSEKLYGNIIIEDDVWIGGNVTILRNVIVGEGSIIGAGSVVNKNIPPYTICVGVPCKPVKLRFDENDLDEHLKLVNSNYTAKDVIAAYRR